MEMLTLAMLCGVALLLWRPLSALRRASERSAERIDKLEQRANDATAKPPVIIATAPEGELQRLLSEVKEAQAAAAEAQAKLAAEVATVRREMHAAMLASGVTAPDAEDLMRRKLAEEGYASIAILQRTMRDDGERFLVSARHGDQTRFGAVMVKDGAVTGVDMRLPTFLFP